MKTHFLLLSVLFIWIFSKAGSGQSFVGRVNIQDGRITVHQKDALSAGEERDDEDGRVQAALANPDLIVTNVSVTDATTPGISYQVTIKNDGAGEVKGGVTFYNAVYLSLDTQIQTTDTKIDDWEVPLPSGVPIPAGATLGPVTLNTTVSGVPSGDYYLGIWLDSKNDIPESNENNNTGYDTSPKVAVTALTAPTGVSATNGTFTDYIDVTWNSVVGATHYKIYRNTVNTTSGATDILGMWMPISHLHDAPTPGLTYYYWVKAASSSSGENESPFSLSDDGWRALSPPTGLTATDGTYTDKVSVSWNSAPGATHYLVFRNTVPDINTSSILGGWQTATTLDDINAPPGALCYYWVQAAVSSGGDRFSQEGNYDTGYKQLIPPQGVSASDGMWTNKVAITWSATVGANHYIVYRNTRPDIGTCVMLHSGVYALNDEDTSADPGRFYFYWVQAIHASNANSASYLGGPDMGHRRLLDPTGVSATNGVYEDKVRVTWNPVTGATGYVVYRGDGTMGSFSLISSDPHIGTVYDDETAVPGRTYAYQVGAKYVSEYGSNTSNLGPDYVEGYRHLAEPSGVSASDGTYTDRVRVSWNSVEGASHYRVYRKDAPDSEDYEALCAWQTDLRYNDTDAVPGVTYWYAAAAAVDASGYRASETSLFNSGYRAQTIVEHPDIGVDPASFDFGSVGIGSYSDRAFVISNTGQADLSVSATTLTGEHVPDFDILGGGGTFSVAPGNTHSVSVRFAPSGEGQRNATLSIASNDPDEDPLEIGLTGAGFSTLVEEMPGERVPAEHTLLANYPNPFNPETTIRYSIPGNAYVTLAVYNVAGEIVRTLVDGNRPRGWHTVTWDSRDELGRSVPGGLYICELRSGTRTRMIRMLLLK